MNEEKDIEQSPEEVDSENSNVNEAPQTTNDNEQAKNMEVHKHPHHVTHKKKWGEYVLEFVMLFLAVFLGFVAENIRENISNREIEKNNIKSFVRNLQEDSLALVQSIEVNEKRFSYLDSLIYLKSKNFDNDIFREQFIYYMMKLGYLNYFTSNESTFEQMESSGTLRLISHQNVLDSILNYETHYQQIKHQEDICSNWWNKAIEQVSAIVDLTALVSLPPNKLWSMTEKDLAGIGLPNISKDSLALRSYYNWRVNERISLGYYIQYLNNQVTLVRTLVPFLNKEYHLEHE